MAEYLNIKVRNGEKVYLLKVSMGDKAIDGEGRAIFDVETGVQSEGRDSQNVSFSTAFERNSEGEVEVVVRVNSEEKLRENVTSILEPNSLAGRVVEALPSWVLLDPFLTCILRSTASSILDVASGCLEDRPEPNLIQRANAFIDCVRRSGARIGIRTLGRIAKCAAVG